MTDPDLAFALLLVGALAILWELHAPGMVLPGVLGVVMLCAGALGLYQEGPTWYGVTLLAIALLLLTVELKFYSHGLSGLAGAVLLAFGATALVPGARGIHPAFAIAAALSAAAVSVFLGLMGMRARRLHPLTGAQRLVGEYGVSRTAIEPEGTVLIRGEYWQARSRDAVAANRRVVVERVNDLLLEVRQG